MSKVRAGGEPVRTFIIDNVAANPAGIVRMTAEKFGCTRQAIHKHIRRLIDEGALVVSGNTRNRRYVLAPLAKWRTVYQLGKLSEDQVWRDDLAPSLGKLPDNVLNIWHYGFTEMLNNVIDHSDAQSVTVEMEKTAAATSVYIIDDGVGIFKKIKAALGLDDERHAVLELAKGKFTTDPKNHSGEGIFFSSRMFDEFEILSGETYFSHEFGETEDWILQRSTEAAGGTLVRMVLHNHTARTTKKIFDAYTADEDYGFNKTVVPVKLMRYGDDNLVSRSQAKRLLGRFERFKVVMLNFTGVATIGQAFADEVFRVFPARHPEVELIATHTSSEVQRMISRARALAALNE
jgi:hypothetical protein